MKLRGVGGDDVHRHRDVLGVDVFAGPVFVVQGMLWKHRRHVLNRIWAGKASQEKLVKSRVMLLAPACQSVPVDVVTGLPGRQGLEGRMRQAGRKVYLRDGQP